MTRHLIDDYGHTTQTTPAMITDEWAVAHLPLTQVALAAAVPVIEAELRARIAADIKEHRRESLDYPLGSDWDNGYHCGLIDAAAIARGGTQC